MASSIDLVSVQDYFDRIPEENRWKLNKVIDSEHGDVPTHLDEIANSMDEWEGRVATKLGLTRAEVAAIKVEHPNKLVLQTRTALQQWKQKNGFGATYRNLILLFLEAEKAGYAMAVCKVLTHALQQEVVFQCPCGSDCSLFDYLNSNCSKPHSKFPYLDSKILTEGDKEDLVQILDEKTLNIKRSFSTLIDSTCKSLESQKVSSERLIRCILSQKHSALTLLEETGELQNADNIDKVFCKIIPHMSFFNYEILQEIITALGTVDDKEKFDTFYKKLRDFCRLSVFEVPPKEYGVVTKDERVLGIKVSMNEMTPKEASLPPEPKPCKVEDIKVLQRKIAKIFGFRVSTFKLCCIIHGCLLMVFAVPGYLAGEILNGIKVTRIQKELATARVLACSFINKKPEEKFVLERGQILEFETMEELEKNQSQKKYKREQKKDNKAMLKGDKLRRRRIRYQHQEDESLESDRMSDSLSSTQDEQQQDDQSQPEEVINADNIMHITDPSLFQTMAPYKYFHRSHWIFDVVTAVFIVYQAVASILITLCEEKCLHRVFGNGLDYAELVRRLCIFALRSLFRVVLPTVFYIQLYLMAEGERKYLESCCSEGQSIHKLSAQKQKSVTKHRPVSVTLWSIVLHALFFSVILFCVGVLLYDEDGLIEKTVCIKLYLKTESPLLSSPQIFQLFDCLAVFFMQIIVGILKDCYGLENKSEAAKKYYNIMRKRWILIDIFCYLTPLFLFVFTLLMIACGSHLLPKPSIEEMDLNTQIMWCFWTLALALLQYCGTVTRKFFKVLCIVAHVACLSLICIVLTFGEEIRIPPGSGVILLYTTMAVTVFNFLLGLTRCHYFALGWRSKYFQFSAVCLIILLLSLGFVAIRETVNFLLEIRFKHHTFAL